MIQFALKCVIFHAVVFLPSLLQHQPLITEHYHIQEKYQKRGIINNMQSQSSTMHAYLWLSLFVCVGLEGQ